MLLIPFRRLLNFAQSNLMRAAGSSLSLQVWAVSYFVVVQSWRLIRGNSIWVKHPIPFTSFVPTLARHDYQSFGIDGDLPVIGPASRPDEGSQ